MPSYLVETFLARRRAADYAALEARARSAADALRRGGACVGLCGVIHVPEDETCFFLFCAPSSGEAARAAKLAELDPVRVVEAVASGEETTR